jgi:hypothetical protein
VAGYCEHGNEPSGFIKTGNFWLAERTVGFSRRTVLHLGN